jgi:quinoprotein relay system zinc metallohydrolase 1
MKKTIARRGYWARALLEFGRQIFSCVGLSVVTSAAQAQSLGTLDYQLKPRQLAPDVYVVEGANADFSVRNGCNIINTGFIVTKDGVLVINTGPSRVYGEQLRRAIARVTQAPIAQVLHLNLHPDYFLGNQGFVDVPRLATTTTQRGMEREAKSYEDNLFRLCGDWMKGTEAVLPNTPAKPGRLSLGGRIVELREYAGHTDSDLVLIDVTSGVVFAGGLVFSQRVPTTPHARMSEWSASLQRLRTELTQTLGTKTMAALVPSHGPVSADLGGIDQTLDYLVWLDHVLNKSAQSGLDINEVLREPVPERFRKWAAFETEFVRNIVHLYPRYEARVLEAGRPKPR